MFGKVGKLAVTSMSFSISHINASYILTKEYHPCVCLHSEATSPSRAEGFINEWDVGEGKRCCK